MCVWGGGEGGEIDTLVAPFVAVPRAHPIIYHSRRFRLRRFFVLVGGA